MNLLQEVKRLFFSSVHGATEPPLRFEAWCSSFLYWQGVVRKLSHDDLDALSRVVREEREKRGMCDEI